MTLSELVADSLHQDGDRTVYVRKNGDRFTGDSEVALLQLSGKEHDMDVEDVAAKYCPGYDYFMELSMIQEMMEEMRGDPGYGSPESQMERILFFREHDE